jgi:hypothetical protein
MLAGAILLVLGISLSTGTPAHAAPRTPAVTGPYFCDVYGYPMCLNEWNGNTGNGQPIKMYQYGNSNEAYSFDEESICSGGHYVDPRGCPFAPGSGLNTRFAGDDIVQIEYASNTSCLGTNTTTAQAVNQNCNDGYGNGGGPGTVFVFADCSGSGTGYYCGIVSKYWSNKTLNPQWVCSVNLNNGSIIYDDYNNNACNPNTQTAWWHWWY